MPKALRPTSTHLQQTPTHMHGRPACHLSDDTHACPDRSRIFPTRGCCGRGSSLIRPTQMTTLPRRFSLPPVTHSFTGARRRLGEVLPRSLRGHHGRVPPGPSAPSLLSCHSRGFLVMLRSVFNRKRCEELYIC